MRRFAPHGRSMAKHLAHVTRREAPRNNYYTEFFRHITDIGGR
jgi:hypothetical protein